MVRPKQELQAVVDSFFEEDAENWESIYSAQDLFSVIHQQRQATALAWLEETGLAAGTPVLEVGCGAGLATVEMARDGLVVTAIDSTPGMVSRARANVLRAGVEGSVTLTVADVHDLPFERGSFGLVIALGVIPWLHSPEGAVAAMAGMLRPGGYLLANVDNARRLEVLLDPKFTPWLSWTRRHVHRHLRRATVDETATRAASTTRHLRTQFDGMLAASGLVRVRATTLGYGPFTFWGRTIFNDRFSVGLHRRLQQLADLGLPGLRSTGAQYLVLARRPAEG